MNRRIWQVPLLALAAMACGTTAKPTLAPPPETAALGQAAPELELAWMNREGRSTLADLRGRVVLLEFWASW